MKNNIEDFQIRDKVKIIIENPKYKNKIGTIGHYADGHFGIRLIGESEYAYFYPSELEKIA